MAKEIFKSKYTGEQVEEKLDNSTKVVGNPVGSAVADLVKIQIGNDIYFLPYGSTVSANADAGEEGGALNSITINGVKYTVQSGGTTVIGNPEGPAVADLKKIQIGNDIYYLPYGTEVQGNPTEDATEELTKISIGDTTYSIPTGQGGGGGGYDLQLNPQFDTITLKRIKYADGRAELNKTFTENTLLHNVVAVSFEAVSTVMAVSGAIITKSPYDEKVYCNALGGDTYITTGNGFTNNTQIILVGKCTMEWSSN